jgi:hypothetical protein
MFHERARSNRNELQCWISRSGQAGYYGSSAFLDQGRVADITSRVFAFIGAQRRRLDVGP